MDQLILDMASLSPFFLLKIRISRLYWNTSCPYIDCLFTKYSLPHMSTILFIPIIVFLLCSCLKYKPYLLVYISVYYCIQLSLSMMFVIFILHA